MGPIAEGRGHRWGRASWRRVLCLSTAALVPGRGPAYRTHDNGLITSAPGRWGSNGSNMLSTTEIAIFLTLGVLFTGGLAVLAYWAKQRPALLAAYALIAVSFLFVGFAIRADNAATWIGFEMTGVAIFGTLAGLAIVGSSWFVVAGLALHPVWALYIHYFGAGGLFAPAPFVWATAGFDVTAALFVVFTIFRGRGKTNQTTASTRRRKGGVA